MRLMFALIMAGTVAALAMLVLMIRSGRETVASDVRSEQAASARSAASPTAEAAAAVRLTRVGSFKQPLHVTAPAADDRRVFVVEQTGTISLIVAGKRRRTPFLDISGRVTSGGERGLLSMAFDPDYASNRRFYVDYTDLKGNTRVVEFKRSARDPDRANRGSARRLLLIDQPFPNHNGGLVLFGPDRMLYIGMGDGGSGGDPANRAQNPNNLLGKLLRIDPRPSRGRPYSIPASNPLVGRAGRDEIFATGLRNPWRFSFDRKTGDLYLADVGQDKWEEVDFVSRGQARGRNFGWSCREGLHPYDTSRSCPGATNPVLETPHSAGNCSITGGVVVRDPALGSLQGRYLYGDYCVGRIFSVEIAQGKARNNRALGLDVAALTSFGEDARGRVYATSQKGPVYRLTR